MKFEDWMNRKWFLLSTNGETSGVSLDCALEFSDGAGGRSGQCQTGHGCAWMSPVTVDYDPTNDRAACTVEVDGKIRHFRIHRYLATDRATPPVLVARQVFDNHRPPGPNEEVGKWTAEEGAGRA